MNPKTHSVVKNLCVALWLCVVTVQISAEEKRDETQPPNLSSAVHPLDPIPQPVTSFGGTILDGNVYIYGGHTGFAHTYSQQEQDHRLRKLNLKTGKWSVIADGPHLQGLALVAHGHTLYRIGGFTAKNAEGEDHDLWSQTSVAAFDLKTKKWAKLPPLPEPRSSFDAAVAGDAIYVLGGWSMQGEAENIWHKTGWKLDLNKQPLKWEVLPTPPFQRRALSVAAYQNHIYAIGGMQQKGGPSKRVDILDLKTGKWSKGPELSGKAGLTGFGTSSFATGGRLYVTTIEGNLQRLSEDGTTWEIIAETPTARFFHRMLPVDAKNLLIVGGANMKTGKFDEVEILDVNSEQEK